MIYNQRMLSKHELREQLLTARLACSQTYIDTACSLINPLLQNILSTKMPDSVHYFEPLVDKHEVNILSTISYLSENNPNIVMVTTRKIANSWRTICTYGISVATPLNYGTIIIPMLGFDASMHRIGYGGGFYDRLLSEHTMAQKIGVCFESGYLRHVPSQAHDIALDCIITEKKVRFP
jgi:5,10-methenyltetrahydrofolate synthetase